MTEVFQTFDLFTGSRFYSIVSDIGYTWGYGIENQEGVFVSPSYQDLIFSNDYSKYEYNRTNGVKPSDFYNYSSNYYSLLEYDSLRYRFDYVGFFSNGTYNITLTDFSDLVILDAGNDGVSVTAGVWANWGGDDRIFGGGGDDTLYIEGSLEDISFETGSTAEGFHVTAVYYSGFTDPVLLVDFEYLKVAPYMGWSNSETVYLRNTNTTGTVLISGDATQNQTLTADTSLLVDEQGIGSLSYQWFRNDTPITGATSNELLLTQNEVGGLIHVVVTHTDGKGTLETVASEKTLDIQDVNDAPVITTTTSLNTNEDIATNIISFSITEPDGDAFTYAFTDPENGNVVDNGDGTFTYTPDANYFGTDSFILEASDGPFTSMEIINVSVNSVNDVPSFSTTTMLSTNEDTATDSIAFSGSDIDGDTLTYTFSDPANGSVVDNGNGTFTYTPDANANGTDSFTITVNDGTVDVTETINVTVNAVNDAPTISTNTSLTTDEDTSNAAIAFIGSDVDGDALTYIFSDPANGSVVDNGNGTFTYTPDANANGTDSFTITVNDGTVNVIETINVSVNAVNDAPTISTTTSLITDEDTATAAIAFAGSDVDGDTLTFTFSDPANGSVVNIGNGTFTYTPDANANGTDSFTITVNDGTVDVTETINVTVNAVNDDTNSGGTDTPEPEVPGVKSIGDALDDVMDGSDGDDTIASKAGDDSISAGAGNDRIAASDGNDTVDGGSGDDMIGGGLGNDSISGGTGHDTIGSGEGNDIVDGGDGNDMVAAGRGDDTVSGGIGDDRLAGSVGEDSINGDEGEDNIGGGYNNDTIRGGSGNDTVGAGQQDDVLYGDEGDDVLNGNWGHDTIYGGDGNDTIAGGDHNDIMTGGNGADVFKFRVFNADTEDRITDFTRGEDLLEMRGSFAGLNISSHADGLQVEKNGHVIILEDVTELSADDFNFV